MLSGILPLCLSHFSGMLHIDKSFLLRIPLRFRFAAADALLHEKQKIKEQKLE